MSLKYEEPVSHNQDSNLLNYSDYYEEWDDDDQVEECPDCYGTGLDKDEIYDCITCGGEGEIRIGPLEIGQEISLTIGPARATIEP